MILAPWPRAMSTAASGFKGAAQVLALGLLLGLGACSPKTTLLEKPGPEAVTDQSLIHPPWEAMVQAGPGAEKDLDLETLNGPGAHPLLTGGQPQTPAATVADAQQAPAAPPAVAATPSPAPEKAAPANPDPNATAIKAVALLPVVGASPQGNRELTQAMRQVLKQAGWPVLDRPRKDALSIQGRVLLSAAVGPQQTVKLDWAVASPKGKDLGHVSQSNQVPAHSLDGAWGQAADYATQGAADGLFKLIAQFR
jgi:hypothetical protein